MRSFKEASIRFGTITLALATVANFCPSLFMWVKYHVFPSKMGELLLLLVASYAVNWIVQPLSYYGTMGTGATYMAWLSGSVGDIKAPAVRMAQSISGYEAGTDEGSVMAVLAVASSTFVSMPILTLFVFIGAMVLGGMPAAVKAAFVFILPAMYGGVYTDMVGANVRTGSLTLAVALLFKILLPKLGIPSGFIILFCVLSGMLFAHLEYKRTEEKK